MVGLIVPGRRPSRQTAVGTMSRSWRTLQQRPAARVTAHESIEHPIPWDQALDFPPINEMESIYRRTQGRLQSASVFMQIAFTTQHLVVGQK